jgi:hypothetical protein
MRILWCALLLSSGLVLAQDNNPGNANHQNSKDSKGQVTVQGCVARASGDYILTRTDPAVSYQLHATGKTKLQNYLGQQVEVTGKEVPTLSTSSDAITRSGSATSVTLNITSIKTISKECSTR